MLLTSTYRKRFEINTKRFHESIDQVPVYDEFREGYEGGGVEYRYADFPLALGEAIMMNHALLAALLHAEYNWGQRRLDVALIPRPR